MIAKTLAEIPGITHGFGTLKEPIVSTHRALYDSHRPHWKQVHGIAFAELVRRDQDCGEIDAMFTFVPGTLALVMTADCVPILLSRADGKAVAAIHAGWRGTLAGIVHEVWKALHQRGEKAKDWRAAIGPSIRACCYEVSPELILEFRKKFAGSEWISNFRNLDLARLNEQELQKIGIGGIEMCAPCTRCTRTTDGTELFFSHRRFTQEKTKEGRQWSSISILERSTQKGSRQTD